MSRVQLALNVDNLEESVAFYTKLFATEPAKVRPGYANFAVAEPPLKLVLIENAGHGGSVNHLGVEVESTELGAQSALGGGGRYDGLVELLGGPATPGVGWAAGVERILLAAKEPVEPARPSVFVALADGAAAAAAFALARDLRSRGVATELEQAGRSLKGQMKHADRLGAAHVVIVGESIEIKDMASGEQHAVATMEDAVAELA